MNIALLVADYYTTYICEEGAGNLPDCDIGTVVHVVKASYGSSPTLDTDKCIPESNNCLIPVPIDDKYLVHIQNACDGRRKCVNVTFETTTQFNCETIDACDINAKMTNFVSIQYTCLRNTGIYLILLAKVPYKIADAIF